MHTLFSLGSFQDHIDPVVCAQHRGSAQSAKASWCTQVRQLTFSMRSVLPNHFYAHLFLRSLVITVLERGGELAT